MKKTTTTHTFFLCIILSCLSLGMGSRPPKNIEHNEPTPYTPPTTFPTAATFAVGMGYLLEKSQPDAKQINKHEVCRMALNQRSDRNYFVPVNSAQEWELFRQHTPAGVNLAGCQPKFLGWSGSVVITALSSHFNRSNPHSVSLRSACDSCHPPFSIQSGYDSQGLDHTMRVRLGAGNGGGTVNVTDQDGNLLYTSAIPGFQWVWKKSDSFVVPASVTQIRAQYVLNGIKGGHWNFIDFGLTIAAP